MKKLIASFLCMLSMTLAFADDPNPWGLTLGKADLQSAGALAFGPDGILFVADSKGAAVFALDIKDIATDTSSTPIEVKNIDKTLAAFLGVAPDDVLIRDMIVNPKSQMVYISVQRGRSADAQPVIVRINRNKELSEVKTDNILYSRAEIPNAPGPDEKTNWGSPKRPMAITDLSFFDNTLYIAGLSNEQFASRLRRVTFPFAAKPEDTSVEIFHTSHNRYETHAPIETMLPLMLNNQAHVLAGYGCAPIAKFSLSDLKQNKHVKGATLAELGGGSRPLDMLLIEKKDEQYVVIANSHRSIYKIKVSDLEKSQPLTTPVDDIFVSSGTPFVATSHVGVMHIDNLNKNFIAAIQRDIQTGELNLVSIPKRWL